MSTEGQPGGESPPQAVGGATILVRIALIFLIVPMLVALVARYLF